MSDLIDLASPDNTKITNTKLSSPLIPLPIDDYNETCESNNPIINLECQQRNMNNNPFDIALQKTNEYISKSEDPFEIVWQKAINPDNSELNSVNYNKLSIADTQDDTICKQKKYSDVLKMNKTLNDTLNDDCMSTMLKCNENNSNNVIISDNNRCQLNELLDNTERKVFETGNNLPLFTINPPSPDYKNLSILNQSVMNDSFSICNSSERPSIGKLFNVKDTTIQHNLSILNQSAMDDSLSGSNSSDNGLIKSIVAQRIATCIQKGITEAETGLNYSNEKFPKLRRSFSQGDQISVQNIKQISSQSSIYNSKHQTFNDYSMPSILYEDPFNRAFLTGSSSNNDTISDISSISTITRLNSVASSSLSTGSNSINNRAFIEDSSSSIQTTLNRIPSTKINRRSTTSALAEISDLVAQLDRLKARTSSVKCPLIDLEKEIPIDQNKSQQHDITSNSVFLDIDPLKQSILSDTCRLKSHYGSNSSSSENDSLPKRPPSAMELLSDIEIHSSDNSKGIVDNLIELQTSNSINEQIGSEEKIKLASEKINKNDQSNNNVVNTTNSMEELEKELVEPDKKLTAATLLMELEKLVNNEKNPKAFELLKNLERVLGVKCQNNVELLEMYIQNTDSMKDTKTTEDNMDKMLPCNKSEVQNTNISEENNKNINSNDDLNKVNCENFGINNNMNIKKVTNKNDKCSNVSDRNVTSSDEITKEHLKSKINKSQNSYNTPKLVADIQFALQKLLTSDNSDPIVFLENLNKALNLTANESEGKLEKISHTRALPIKCTSTSSLKKTQMPCPSTKSSTVRRSVESSNTLKKPTVLQRRSSVSRVNNMSLENNTKTKTRIDSPKKIMVRRSSSDPDFINNIKLTKNIVLNPLKLKPPVSIASKNMLRKNHDTVELTTKKGPLKALIPLGNMQRRESSAKKLAPLSISPTTPPSHKSNVSSGFVGSTSTPLPDFQINMESLKPSSKRKPVASSTPEINSKTVREKLPVPRSPKHNMSWNISPVTPTAPKISTHSNNLISRNSSMRRSQINKNQISPKSKNHTSLRSERTPESSKKISFLPRGQLLTQSDGKVRHVRRSEPIKTNLSAKTDLLQRMGKQKISSPLKESNTPGKKTKTINLLSKFQRRSGNVHVVEKENKWK